MAKQIIKLGVVAKCRITGFEGRVTGHTEYISGCDQYLLVAPSKDGKAGEAGWYDQQRLVVTDPEAIVLDNVDTPGSDQPAPIR